MKKEKNLKANNSVNIVFPLKTESAKSLISFIDYCNEHPRERFWQALRNWSGKGFIYASDISLHIHPDKLDKIITQVEDTFYW